MRESIVQLVFFVALVAVAAVLVGVLTTGAAEYADAVDGGSEREAAAIDAELVLVNDAESDANYDGERLTLHVKNLGSDSLDPDALEVLVDGEYYEPAAVDVPAEGWRAGSTLTVDVEADLDPGDRRAVVRVDGAEDRLTFEYRIAFWTADQPDLEAIGDGRYAFDATDAEGFDATMATEPPQAGVDVEYAVDDTDVATVGGEETAGGETDGDGEDAVTLELADGAEDGDVVEISLGTGWDDDSIVVVIEDDGEDDDGTDDENGTD